VDCTHVTHCLRQLAALADLFDYLAIPLRRKSRRLANGIEGSVREDSGRYSVHARLPSPHLAGCPSDFQQSTFAASCRVFALHKRAPTNVSARGSIETIRRARDCARFDPDTGIAFRCH
jgi:hypothetical protein